MARKGSKPGTVTTSVEDKVVLKVTSLGPQWAVDRATVACTVIAAKRP